MPFLPNENSFPQGLIQVASLCNGEEAFDIVLQLANRSVLPICIGWYICIVTGELGSTVQLLPVLQSPTLPVQLQQDSGDMPVPKVIAFLAAVTDFGFCGLLSNGFITAVLITEWAKSRSLPACEQLFLSLGISNICCTCVLIGNIITSNTTLPFSKSVMMMIYASLSFWVVFLRYWLTAWLCVFYCIKILNSTHSLFIWWKMRISRLVPWLIMGSCVIFFFSSFFIVLSFCLRFQSNGTANITNITKAEKIGELWSVQKSFILAVSSGCPLLIVFLCSILVLIFLCRHVGQITNKGSNIRSFQTKVHIKAARTVLSLLFLYISYCVIRIALLYLQSQENPISPQEFLIVRLMYSPVQGAILVLSNPKLKLTASRMLARS